MCIYANPLMRAYFLHPVPLAAEDLGHVILRLLGKKYVNNMRIYIYIHIVCLIYAVIYMHT